MGWRNRPDPRAGGARWPRVRRTFRCLGASAAVALIVSLLHYGCGARRFEVRTPPPAPFEAVIIPGCPSGPSGELSRCQARRAMWAAMLWERGVAERFITSGAAVYSPYIEAEALALAMTTLGVPPDRIYLDRHALHTDENIYNAVQIARGLGLTRLAVASDRGQAVGACQMLEDFLPKGQSGCGAFSMDYSVVEQHLQASPHAPALRALRAPRVQDSEFIPLRAREQRRALASGRLRRPPSFIVYPVMALLRMVGRRWVPTDPAPEEGTVAVTSWAVRARDLGLQPLPATNMP